MEVYVFQKIVKNMKPDMDAQQLEMHALPVNLVDNVMQILKNVFMTNFYKLQRVVAHDVYHQIDVQNFKMYVFFNI